MSSTSPTADSHTSPIQGKPHDLEQRLQQLLGAGYRIVDELTPGGMSRVFAAEELELGRQIVIKVLPPDLAAEINIDRFRREIQTAARLQHPHLVPLLFAGSRDGLLYYTMPRIEGESLRARLKRCGQLPIAESVRFLRDVADALEYAHSHGIVHRDVKPDNILISGHHAFVTDFGVAKALSIATDEPILTLTGLAIGTPAYMSPEQACGDPAIDTRTDIYSLGILGYEMIAGAPPFTGQSAQQILAAQITKAPTPLAARRPELSNALANLVMRCLEKDPRRRFQTAEEVREQLELAATFSPQKELVRPASNSPYVARRIDKNRKPRDEEIDVYGISHRGLVRANNDDHFLIGSLRKRVNVRLSSLAELSQIPLGEERIASFIMMADGLGAGAKAEQASRLALEVATRYVAESARCYVRVVEEEMDLGHALEEAARACHEAIQERAAAAPSTTMASSLTLFIAVWPWVYLLHTGTSRYYQFRDGKLIQCSVDQELMQPSASGFATPPLVTRLPNSWNTLHLLCTDGLTKHVSDERITERLVTMQSARQVCEDLLQDALDNGGTDNVTIAVGRPIDKD